MSTETISMVEIGRDQGRACTRAIWSEDEYAGHNYCVNIASVFLQYCRRNRGVELARCPFDTQDLRWQLACLGNVTGVAMFSIITGTSDGAYLCAEL
jgi:hypothetical protein